MLPDCPSRFVSKLLGERPHVTSQVNHLTVFKLTVFKLTELITYFVPFRGVSLAF